MSEINETTTSSEKASLLAENNSQSFSDYIDSFMKRVKSGDLGSLPIILGWLLLVIIFQTQNENFLTARNFVSLIQQMAGIMTIAIGYSGRSPTQLVNSPAPLRIGDVVVDPPVVLAPMAGVTNYPFRALCRRFGAGLYISEMITARPLVEGREKTLKLADFGPDERPRSLQIYGVDPEQRLGEAGGGIGTAKVVCAHPG